MTVRELRRVAEIVRIAAIAEHARIIGDTDTVDAILNRIDPNECDELAAKLDFDAGVRALGRRLFPRTPSTTTSTRKPW